MIKNIDWKFIGIIFLLWRGLISVGELIGLVFLPFNRSFPYIDSILESTHLPQWLWQWGNFDGVHYLDIIQNGYHGYGVQVFFPVYPLLAKPIDIIISQPIISALIVSHLAIFLGAAALYKLTKENFDQAVARWTVAFLFFFPTSFFFGAVYTESLFLLFVVLAFILRGFLAGIFGLLAGGTRLVGFFVGPARILFRPRNWWSVLSVGGLAAYVAYLYWRFSEPLIFLEAQKVFQNARASSLSTLVNPIQVVFRYLKIFVTANPSHFDFWIAALEFSSFAFGAGILVWLLLGKKVPCSYLFFGSIALILPTISGTLSSMPRYLLTVFPIFIGLALIRNKWARYGILGVFIVLLLALTSLFTRGYFVS